MTNEACTELLEDSDYQVQHFGKMGDWCIYWAPYPDHDIRLLPSDDECVLPARYMYSSHIIPGRLALGDDALYTIFEGNRLNTYDTIGQEVLQVHPQCHAIWMRYTVGDVIPMGAVIGGYIAGVGGYDLYIIKVPPHNGYDQFGYFDPKLNQGIVDLYGMQTYTEMEMLVLIWSYTPEHIEAETKWTPFRRRHLHVHFREWKCLNSD